MRVVEWIERKRQGGKLTDEEMTQLIQGYISGEVPDYQMSAFCMAVVFQGMDDEETSALTQAMADSGDVLELPGVPRPVVDKHSTGGVGDKTTIALAPWLASIGVTMAKMSGRGLGHTGGTVDKLESIPGFRTNLSASEFLRQVKEIGVAVAGQTGELAPADKSLYALRDVTGTVSSIPLIAASIMSKKLASGADAIVLDVKVGDGAFMKTAAEARELASRMVRIGELRGRKTVAILSHMEEPLGYAVGNALEVKEAIDTLRGDGPPDFTELCLALGAETAVLAGVADSLEEAREKMREAVQSGRALAKFAEFVKAQGGSPLVAEDTSILPRAPVVELVRAHLDGYVASIHAEATGRLAMRLGAGRATKEDRIDLRSGLVFRKKTGDFVRCGEVLVEIHATTSEAAAAAVPEAEQLFTWANSATVALPIVVGRVDAAELQAETEAGRSLAATPESAAPGASVIAAALAARDHAYVPYSNFPVGAALQLRDGRMVTGCNVENASFGLTNCAERSAIFRAISEYGVAGMDVVAVAVAADTEGPVSPCGACRQVLMEFCRADVPVFLTNVRGQIAETTVGALLPHAFLHF
ncbi:MAG: pyrimidine-nucleoside phosphorylase [Alicyclobacillaceae bacterium]|nr:pyrimidine-nucleoside phosphorylase [Alicyclobacillaceae bacterium]